jgi:hypothetical protein
MRCLCRYRSRSAGYGIKRSQSSRHIIPTCSRTETLLTIDCPLITSTRKIHRTNDSQQQRHATPSHVLLYAPGVSSVRLSIFPWECHINDFRLIVSYSFIYYTSSYTQHIHQKTYLNHNEQLHPPHQRPQPEPPWHP